MSDRLIDIVSVKQFRTVTGWAPCTWPSVCAEGEAHEGAGSIKATRIASPPASWPLPPPYHALVVAAREVIRDHARKHDASKYPLEIGNIIHRLPWGSYTERLAAALEAMR